MGDRIPIQAFPVGIIFWPSWNCFWHCNGLYFIKFMCAFNVSSFGCVLDVCSIAKEDAAWMVVSVEGRHVTVKLLLLIYGRLDGRSLKFWNPISSSARCQAFYSSLCKVHGHSIANCLSIVSSALLVQVVQWATHPCSELFCVSWPVG